MSDDVYRIKYKVEFGAFTECDASENEGLTDNILILSQVIQDDEGYNSKAIRAPGLPFSHELHMWIALLDDLCARDDGIENNMDFVKKVRSMIADGVSG